MKEIKKVLLCGIGAIGCVYAEKMLKFDVENFRVLVDANRFERYSKEPLIFNGEELNPKYVLPDCTDFKADLIIIAVKNFNLDEVITNIKNFINEDTIIMSLLNGISSEKKLAQKYGANHLIYSYFIGHSAVRENRSITQDGINTTVIGNFENNDNAESVKIFLNKLGLKCEIPEDIIYSLWLKYMLNVSSNQVSAILRYNFGQMLNNEKCMDLIINIMKEVRSIAKAEGVRNTDRMLDDAINAIHTMSPEGRTSMLQDIESGRMTEVDAFAGTIIELGKKHGIMTPYNIVLKELIDAIQC